MLKNYLEFGHGVKIGTMEDVAIFDSCPSLKDLVDRVLIREMVL